MKFSSKIQRCELSPMRKFLPYELAAEAKGRKIYHLNIGQPDIETPKVFFDTIREFRQPVAALRQPRGNPDGLLQEEQLIRGSCGSLLQVLQLLIC